MIRTTMTVPTMPATDAVVDRVGAQAGPDLPLLDDLERNGQRAGLQCERQVLGLLERAAGKGDLSVAADPALDDGRRPLHPAVQDNRHEVADMASGLVAELAPAGPVELEGDDGPVGQRVDLGLGVLEVAAGDDRLLVQRVEEAIDWTPTLVGWAFHRSTMPRGSWRATSGRLTKLSTRG